MISSPEFSFRAAVVRFFALQARKSGSLRKKSFDSEISSEKGAFQNGPQARTMEGKRCPGPESLPPKIQKKEPKGFGFLDSLVRATQHNDNK